MTLRSFCRLAIWVAILVGGMSVTPFAAAQVLFVDEFDGTHGNAAFHPGGVVDVTSYRAPFGVGGDNFVGRTNFRFALPQDGVTTAAGGSTDGKVAVLNLDTFNPNAPGASFLGTDVISKRNFAVGGGLRMVTRMRVQSGIPGGMVAAPFLYDTQRESPPGTLVRDEIDHEIITNNAQSPPPHNTLTNVWNDGNFASPGAPQTITNPAGFNVTQFHDYRTDWTPTSVKWYIDDVLVRTETSVVPDDPMRAHVNFWAPDSTFGAAFNAGLTPTGTSPGTTYKVEVDRMQIERINTNVSGNLLADGSFETFTPPAANGTGGWTVFNNAFPDTGPPASPACTPPRTCPAGVGNPQDGILDLKTYGHFIGQTDASGAFQNVPASPGQQFEGSVWAYSPTSDSILGRQNFTNITLSFVNAAGQVIGSVNFSPGTNEKNTPIFDGRDANMPENQWVQYTVNAVAPPGTAFVRESLFFIQLYHLADYNNNGTVDASDYVIWRKNVGQSSLFKRNPAITGPVGADDYTFWRSQFGAVEDFFSTIDVGDPGAVWFDNASLVLLTPQAGAGTSAAVPEPGSLCLAALALLVATGIVRRR
jgi:glycosyl hydrolase family 16/PEP-CTERM motif-containing protein